MTASCTDCRWTDDATYSLPAATKHAGDEGHTVVDE